MKTKVLLSLGVFIFILTSALPAFAETVYWDGEGTSDLWSDHLNWNSDINPVDGDDVLLDGDLFGSYFSVIYDEPALSLNSLTIDWDAWLDHSLCYSLSVGQETIGNFSYGFLYQSGGSHSVTGDLYQGYNSEAFGDYLLTDGGSLSVGGNHLIAGDGGAYFELDGSGVHTVNNDLNLGQGSASNGQYDLIQGDLIVYGNLNNGHEGTGAFSQSLGSNTIHGDLALGTGSGVGYYDLYDGSLSVTGGEFIGSVGNGWFEQYNGTHENFGHTVIGQYTGSEGYYTQEGGDYFIDGNFTIAAYNGSFGEYTLNDGTLAVNLYNNRKEVFIGNGGTGYFYQNGGFFDAHDSGVYLGNQSTSSGTYIMTGGQFDASGMALGEWGGTAYFLQDGGTVNMLNDHLTLARQGSSTGTYDIWNGDLNIQNGDLVVGKLGFGTFNQTGGTVNVSGNVIISATPNSSWGIYNLTYGTLNAGTINNNGKFYYSGGQLNASISNSAGATVDVSGAGTTINGDFHNHGTFKVTNTTTNITGSFHNFNAFISDPATTHVQDLIVEGSGYISAGVGDEIHITGNFKDKSTRNQDFQTRNAQLFFDGSAHEVMFNSLDLGPQETAYDNNFGWGHVDFGLGTFTLITQDDGRLGALYTGTIGGIDVSGDILNNFSGDNNIYYLAQANSWLNGKTYDFATGHGQLIAAGVVPEPISSVLFTLGSAVLAASGIRKKRSR